MARLWSSGFELNTVTTGVEFDIVNTNFTVQSSTVRGGSYAGSVNLSSSTGYIQSKFSGSDIATNWYFRVYLNIGSLPTANNTPLIELLSNISNLVARIDLLTNGTLILRNNLGTQQGSASSTLSSGVWYRIEVNGNGAGTGATATIAARLDGSQFASGSASSGTSVAFNTFRLGQRFSTTALLYFDDIAINDSTGSFQNSYPGAGSIVHLRPSAAGDNTQWTSTGTNWTAVSEITPDDATSGNRATVLNKVDDYNIDDTPAAINSGDTINVVSVGARFTSDSAADPSKFKLRFKSSSGGTVALSSEITPTSTSYVTNAPSTPFSYPITLYQTPDTTTLTKSNLDTSQIGAIVTTASAGSFVSRISTEWLLVEYFSPPLQTIGPTGIDSTVSFGAPALTPGPVSISPASIDPATAIGAPSLAFIMLPSSIASTAALGTPTVSPGAVSISPNSIASILSLGSPVVAGSAVSFTPSSILSTLSFGTPNGGIVPPAPYRLLNPAHIFRGPRPTRGPRLPRL